MLKSVRRSRIVEDFRGKSEVALNLGSFLIDDYTMHSSPFRDILGDGYWSIVDLELLDGPKMALPRLARHDEQ